MTLVLAAEGRRRKFSRVEREGGKKANKGTARRPVQSKHCAMSSQSYPGSQSNLSVEHPSGFTLIANPCIAGLACGGMKICFSQVVK